MLNRTTYAIFAVVFAFAPGLRAGAVEDGAYEVSRLDLDRSTAFQRWGGEPVEWSFKGMAWMDWSIGAVRLENRKSGAMLTFRIPEVPRRARLSIESRVDGRFDKAGKPSGCPVRVKLNRKTLERRHEPSSEISRGEWDVSQWLEKGKNRLAILAETRCEGFELHALELFVSREKERRDLPAEKNAAFHWETPVSTTSIAVSFGQDGPGTAKLPVKSWPGYTLASGDYERMSLEGRPRERNLSHICVDCDAKGANGTALRLRKETGNVTFTVDLDSHLEDPVVRLRHMAAPATYCPDGGFARVDVKVNGKKLAENLNPGSKKFETAELGAAGFFKPGRNRIEIAGSKFCTAWLLQRIEIANAR